MALATPRFHKSPQFGDPASRTQKHRPHPSRQVPLWRSNPWNRPITRRTFTQSIMSHSEDSSAAAAVASINFKLPEFWSSDSELWFSTIESSFRKNKITFQQSKFDHVVSSLPQTVAAVVRDFLRAPPQDMPYDILKTELIRRTTESEQRRLQQLLTSEELGDRKPSELLRRMEQLLGDKANTLDASILRELFLQRPPTQVRMILSTSATDSIETLARMADQIMDVNTPNVCQLTHPNPSHRTSLLNETLPQLLESNKVLTSTVARLSEDLKQLRLDTRRSTTRQVSDSPPRRRRSRSANSSGTCWYHRTFGNRARRCEPPCTFQENRQARR